MHGNKILRKIAKSRDDESLCDLQIVCGKRRFNAHRYVVALNSSVIKKACLEPCKEGTSSVYEIKNFSSVLVERMLDYMYTGTYDELPSKSPAKEGEEPTQKAAKLSPAAHVMLHAKMMELGDTYKVEGLSQHASERFETLIAPETTRNLVVDIVPKVYALKFPSSTKIREIVVLSLMEKNYPPPLKTDIVEMMAEAARVVPQFGNDMFMSYCKFIPTYSHWAAQCRT
ncbi:hypothetical protein E4U13_008375 [Claviceps humidiphila]|uniref:BTB domain-containing protein n=1 Tax=Claviceps humidiphila TaxID=1294629 RepID=A0A9P7TPW1_9HYPO|nr:hypothetical protein E4U13_008375 [Claviceps humidiphila]